MGIKRLSLCLLLLLPGIYASGDNYTVGRIDFLPPEYYVGDEVEVRVRLSVEEGVVPAEPSELPAPGRIHIKDVRIIPFSDEYDVRISFSVYETGAGILPPIELGDITLSGVEIGAVSILENGATKVEEVFGPLLLPGTRLLLALGIGALLIVPAFSVFAVIWIKRFIRHMRSEWYERKPFKELSGRLDEMEDPASTINSRDFYFKLTDIFKDYLTGRLEADIQAFTASELVEDLKERFKGIAPVEKISADFARFDEVKFGNLAVDNPQRKVDILQIREAAAAIEEWKQEVQHVDS